MFLELSGRHLTHRKCTVETYCEKFFNRNCYYESPDRSVVLRQRSEWPSERSFDLFSGKIWSLQQQQHNRGWMPEFAARKTFSIKLYILWPVSGWLSVLPYCCVCNSAFRVGWLAALHFGHRKYVRSVMRLKGPTFNNRVRSCKSIWVKRSGKVVSLAFCSSLFFLLVQPS